MYNTKNCIVQERYLICSKCGKKVPMFSNDITNAWQKNGYNSYDQSCECGNIMTFNIKVEDDEN